MGGGEDGGYVEGLEGMGALLLLFFSFFFKKMMKEKMKKEHGIIHKNSEYDNKYMNLVDFCLLLASTAQKNPPNMTCSNIIRLRRITYS